MLIQLFSGELLTVNRLDFISDTAFYTHLTHIYDTQYNTKCLIYNYADELIKKSVGINPTR